MTKATVAGFEATGKLDRTDWGLTYGKGLVGDDVALEIQIEAGVAPMQRRSAAGPGSPRTGGGDAARLSSDHPEHAMPA